VIRLEKFRALKSDLDGEKAESASGCLGLEEWRSRHESLGLHTQPSLARSVDRTSLSVCAAVAVRTRRPEYKDELGHVGKGKRMEMLYEADGG